MKVVPELEIKTEVQSNRGIKLQSRGVDLLELLAFSMTLLSHRPHYHTLTWSKLLHRKKKKNRFHRECLQLSTITPVLQPTLGMSSQGNYTMV